MKRGFVVLAALAVLFSRTGNACSDNYGGPGLMGMPTAMFDQELRRILGLPEPPESRYSEWLRDGRGEQNEDPYAHSCEADEADLATALQGKPEAEDILQRYHAMRDALTNHISKYLEDMRDAYNREYAKRPAILDLTPYEETLARLPQEFSLYFRGAVAYHGGDWEAAIRYFQSVLKLPAEERRFRTTWAAFMLGKTWVQKDPKQAGPFFEQVRTLAAEGFQDPLGLVRESNNWQGQAQMLAGDFVGAIHRYVQDPVEAYLSLRIVCREALDHTPVEQSLVQDDLARQVITAWLVAHGQEEYKRNCWLTALETFKPAGPVPGAEYLAWVSYEGGKMEDAARWLTLCDASNPYAHWVQAKLLLREGKFPEAAESLKQLAKAIPEDGDWMVHDPHDGEMWASTFAHAVVCEELSDVLLKCSDYTGALDAAVESEDAYNLEYIPERILTADELKTFIDARPDDDAHAMVRWRLARRFAREGRWDKALPYFSGEDDRKLATQAKAHWDVATDPKQPDRSRAAHYIELGLIIREHGQDLICPDSYPGIGYQEAEAAGPSSDLARRYEESLRPYPEVNYFVWIAADYMWQAAQLLPNNDLLCAKALFCGGSYLKNMDPQKADEFYKALVRCNPNLLIAQQADKLRWFPREFTPAMAYHPRTPDPWYGRKRYVAYAGLPFIAPALLAGFLGMRRRRRAAAPAPPEAPAEDKP